MEYTKERTGYFRASYEKKEMVGILHVRSLPYMGIVSICLDFEILKTLSIIYFVISIGFLIYGIIFYIIDTNEKAEKKKTN